ncbi:gluconokinase [Neoasaia chiangmaiensis NBRC 101099]|uniref:gluconokinase n=1 Tax=Neoasaia chiangmaiensis TaxID=320497 RepID=UPI0011913A32|nr:gluconokinase [Neoasaia chiangmaiensis]GBR39265.1 gluconokinase [Neoasaia chiangmaiensis NBRC 101099]GEN14499.1 gluconokinase [Neoasaia chiangmaiensis]
MSLSASARAHHTDTPSAPHVTPLVVPSTRTLAGRRPLVLVVMGVSGCGKSTLADALATALGWNRLEGDELHPKNNIDKMSAGIPLTDEDRFPWLQEIAARAQKWIAQGECGVITCSALKERYREILCAGTTQVCFIYLKGTREQIFPRLSQRKGHFMPTKMLDSQFNTLEEPGQHENMMELDVMASVPDLTKAVVKEINALPQ